MQILITGGAGFIGSNAASFFLKKNHKVTILDNLSRIGGKANLDWILKTSKVKPNIVIADIRKNLKLLNNSVAKADVIIHLAGQVAVTTSVVNPYEDFEINAMGTLNVLEAVRKSGNNPVFVYSSTNKVYGGLDDLKITEGKKRYSFRDFPYGVSENRNLDFHSPYGCSKGAADQYVRDYSRIYGLNTVVLRQSCIYGPRQFGIEDQGWLAWFIIALTKGKKITIYGDGKQVRDVLYIDDLLRAYDLAIKNIKTVKGNIYNIGGGIKNTISIWEELHPILEKLLNKEIRVSFSDWRPGDQKIFVSDIRKAKKDLGWEPEISVEDGVKNLFLWVQENKNLFS